MKTAIKKQVIKSKGKIPSKTEKVYRLYGYADYQHKKQMSFSVEKEGNLHYAIQKLLSNKLIKYIEIEDLSKE